MAPTFLSASLPSPPTTLQQCLQTGFNIQQDTGDQPEFAALAAEFSDVLCCSSPGLLQNLCQEFELRMETG
jgi:hypothetical protein